MKQYFVDLKDLTDEKVSFSGSFEPGILDFASDNARQVGPLNWSASAERVGDEVRIAGSLEVAMELMCSRCLDPATVDITRPFDLYFRQRDELLFDEDQDIELDERDTQTAFFAGTELAIGEILREQVLLGLPMKALCRTDCKGLCPTCGVNLNSNTCTCPSEKFRPHMDALLEVKRRLENRSDT